MRDEAGDGEEDVSSINVKQLFATSDVHSRCRCGRQGWKAGRSTRLKVTLRTAVDRARSFKGSGSPIYWISGIFQVSLRLEAITTSSMISHSPLRRYFLEALVLLQIEPTFLLYCPARLEEMYRSTLIPSKQPLETPFVIIMSLVRPPCLSCHSHPFMPHNVVKPLWQDATETLFS